LSKIHHAESDAHLIGIDPHYRVHVSDRLLARHDGPMLDALHQRRGGMIYLPERAKDRPDRGRPAQQFEEFKVRA
jgi:putative restriction endonuclease